MKAWFFAAKMVGAAVSFITAIVLARLMPLDDFGRYALVIALGGIADMLLLAWIGTSITRLEKAPELKGCALSGGLGLMLVVQAATIALAGVLFTAIPIPHGPFAALIALQAASAALFDLALVGLRLQSRGAVFTLMVLLRAVLTLAAGGGAAQSGMGYEAVALATMSASLFVGALGFLVVALKSGVDTPSLQLTSRFLNYGGPLGVARSRGLLTNAISQVALTTFTGPGSAGAYAAALNLTNRSMQQIALILLSVWAPDIFRAYEADGVAKANRVLQQLMAFLLLLVMPLAIIFVAGSNTIATIVFGADKADVIAPFIQILAIAVLINSIQGSVISVPLLIMERTSIHFFLAIIFSLFHALATWVLVKNLGQIGAAFAAIATALFSSLIIFVFVRRFFSARYDWVNLTHIVIASTASFLIAIVANTQSDIILSAVWLILSGLVFLIILIVFKFSAIIELKTAFSRWFR